MSSTTTPSSDTLGRILGAVRAGHGLLLLLQPDLIADPLLGRRLTEGERRIARILAGRQLVQALGSGIRPNRRRLTTGAAIDLVHAASMIAAAIVSGQHRRAALTSGAAAGLYALAGLLIARRTDAVRQRSDPTGRQRRDR